MELSTFLKPLIILLHIFVFFLGFLAIELILYFKKRDENLESLNIIPSTTFFDSIKETIKTSFGPYLLSSWRRFGTIVFSLTCLCSIGFITNMSFFMFLKVEEMKDFLQTFWKVDAFMCYILLFFVIPLGLSHKYIKLTSQGLLQKIVRSLGFVLFWIAFGSLFGYIILNDMYFLMRNKHPGFLFTCIYYMCGYGLFFVAVLVGFSGIYFPYLLYIINRDVSSVRQLESLISDCNKARKDLRLRMLENSFYFSEDSAEDELYMSLEVGTPVRSTDDSFDCNASQSPKSDQLLTSYRPAEMCVNFDEDQFGNQSSTMATSRVNSFTRKLREIKLKISKRIYKIKCSKAFGGVTGTTQQYSETNFNMWVMMNDLKSDLDYLKMLKKEKESISKWTGKVILVLKCLIAGGCMVNCFKIFKRAVLIIWSNYSQSLTRIENQKIITRVYYEFLKDEIISSILYEVLEGVKLPSAFDYFISRANSIFLACVMISSVGYFLDFGRILLKTKYLQKNKLLSDTSLGLALSCFMILTFPSQFVLVVPFLPIHLKLPIIKFLFQDDIYVFFGLRVRFDLIVMVTILATFVGVLCLHFSRSFNKLSYHVGCNV